MTLLFAIAAGVSVGNLYWAQPLLTPIAKAFGISLGNAGLVITVTQIGYAIGVFLIVPLGDTINRRHILPIVMVLASMALLVISGSPSFSGLLLGAFFLGFFTVSGQILTPLAGDLATDDQRGRVLGVVTSGLMLGILMARAASGLLADIFGWRPVFLFAAAIMVIMSVIIARHLPSLEPKQTISYGKLLLSIFTTFKKSTSVKLTVLLGVLPMSVFTLFWTGLTFLLSAEPFSYSAGQIGLMGLLAIAGAVAVQGAGRLYDKGLSLQGLGCGLVLAIVSIIISGIGETSFIAIVIGVILFSIGLQAVLVLAQTRMLAIDPAARSRLNTAYVVCNFLAGAIGSAAAGMLWDVGGWRTLMFVAAITLLVALLVWRVTCLQAACSKSQA